METSTIFAIAAIIMAVIAIGGAIASVRYGRKVERLLREHTDE